MKKKKKVALEEKLVDDVVEILNPWFERLDTFPDILNRAANDLELIPTSRFTDITFQDANISSKLFTLVQKTFNRRIIHNVFKVYFTGSAVAK